MTFAVRYSPQSLQANRVAVKASEDGMSHPLVLRSCSIILTKVKTAIVDSGVWDTSGFLADPLSEPLNSQVGHFSLIKFGQSMFESHLCGGKRMLHSMLVISAK